MSDSILTSTKKILGLAEDYTAFDLDVVTHINSVFLTLNQLGVGPVNGFMIEDAEALWTDFVGTNVKLNAVKTYVYLRVRLMFDPPANSYLITSMEKQVQELEWRLNVEVDTRPRSYLNDEGDLVWILETDEPFPPEASLGDLGINPATGDVWRNVV